MGWEDGWILMAIHMSENNNGASLCDIISAADATNHTIPTADELTKSFTKFFSAFFNSNFRKSLFYL